MVCASLWVAISEAWWTVTTSETFEDVILRVFAGGNEENVEVRLKVLAGSTSSRLFASFSSSK